MDTQDNIAPDGGEGLPGPPLGGGGRLEPGISVVTAAGDQDFPSVSRAARALTQARQKSRQDRSAAAEHSSAEAPHSGANGDETANPTSADLRIKPVPAAERGPGQAAADAPQESAAGFDPAADAAPRPREGGDTEVRGETEGADPAEPPPIEPPRSWTDEDKELWKGLPRVTQMRLAERERSRESDFLRRQNEAADKLKGLAAREQATEQVRREYEAALPALLQSLQDQQADEFADIKSPADIEKLAREDRPRYLRWEAKQQKIASLRQQVAAGRARAVEERQHRWTASAKRQDELFVGKVPDYADGTEATRLQNAAVAVLNDIGFTEQELEQLWRGDATIPLRDHRMQLLILNGIKYRDAQQKAKDVVAKPAPPQRRPGVSQPRGAAQDAQIQALNQRLETSGKLKDAAALIAARRKAAR